VSQAPIEQTAAEGRVHAAASQPAFGDEVLCIVVLERVDIFTKAIPRTPKTNTTSNGAYFSRLGRRQLLESSICSVSVQR
jgi:hypothetical protein